MSDMELADQLVALIREQGLAVFLVLWGVWFISARVWPQLTGAMAERIEAQRAMSAALLRIADALERALISIDAHE